MPDTAVDFKIIDRENYSHIIYGEDVLTYSKDIGGPIYLNDKLIPSDRLWSLFVDHAVDKTELDLEYLMMVAQDSALYRLVPAKRLVVTAKPVIEDEATEIGGVYLRTEPQRVRPLMHEWDAILGVISQEPTAEAVDRLVAAMRSLGYEPVDELDGRYYAVRSDRILEFMLAVTGGYQPVPQQLGKFLKRPGSTGIPLDLRGLPTFDEKDNDGTIAITTDVNKPMQGTFYSTGSSGVVMAKGIIRPPLYKVPHTRQEAGRRIIVEEQCRVGTGSFKRDLQPEGVFYALSHNPAENCKMNYQTAVFSLKDPATLIRSDTAEMDLSALASLSALARQKVAAGIPAALLMGDFSPWSVIGSFSRKGVRAKVYGSYKVPKGYFGLLPRSMEEMANLFGPENLLDQPFLIHRDPALPDGTCTYEARCVGEFDFYGSSRKERGVVINPHDPLWKAAGGDFDGDSAAVFAGSQDDLISRVDRWPLRLDGHKFSDMDVVDRFKAQLEEPTANLLGPLVLAAVRLMERGILGEQMRAAAATAIQSAVEAKKHPVDHNQVMGIAQELFTEVRETRLIDGLEFITTLLNLLKNASGDAAKLEAWERLVEGARDILQFGYPESNAEVALSERVLAVDQMFRDIGFLRAAVRPELPPLLRNRARQLRTDEAFVFIDDISKLYRSLLQERDELRNLGDQGAGYATQDEFETRLKRLRAELSNVREQYRYYLKLGTEECTAEDLQIAMLAYGPPKLAAQFVSLEVIQSLAASSKEVFVNLIDHNWKDGFYKLGDLRPVPNCVADLKLFGPPDLEVELRVVSTARRSTRVHLRTFSMDGKTESESGFLKGEINVVK